MKPAAFPEWHFGCPLVYAALDWARAYRALMEDYCSIKKALARFAWNYETKGGNQAIAAIQSALGRPSGTAARRSTGIRLR